MQSSQTHQELERTIQAALSKVAAKKENDLCRYLPGESGGYIHHFTMRKIKNANPEQLFDLLKKFIINNEAPRRLPPKPRAPRGSKKRRDLMTFSRTDIERVLDLARRAGDDDVIARFSPKRSLPALKRELIRSIREERVNEDLWLAYKNAMLTLEGEVVAAT